jgi:hypothetical protein
LRFKAINDTEELTGEQNHFNGLIWFGWNVAVACGISINADCTGEQMAHGLLLASW